MSKDYDDFVERMTSFDLDLSADGTTGANMIVSDSKPSLDTALAHYGVKGMKWGVRRANRQEARAARRADKAKAEARTNQLVARVAKAEDRFGATFDKAYKENRAKGLGRIAANRAAGNDPRVKKAEAEFNRIDAQLSGPKKAPKQKVTTEQIKTARLKNEVRVGQIQKANAEYYLATTKAGKNKALSTVAKYSNEINNDPDTRIASKLTRGEKVALTIMSGGTAIPAIALNAASTRQGSWDKKVDKWNAQTKKSVAKSRERIASGKG